MMLGWKGVVLLRRSLAVSRRFSERSLGRCRLSGQDILGVDNLNVVQSIARLLDYGTFFHSVVPG